MRVWNFPKSTALLAACGLATLVSVTSTGCQVDVNGQTLPSPWWQTDDVQYFPPGPEFKLAREAAALEAMRAQQGPTSGGAMLSPAPGMMPGAAPVGPMGPAPMGPMPMGGGLAPQ